MSVVDVKSNVEQKVPMFTKPSSLSGKDETLDGVAVLSITAGGATAVAATPQEIADAQTATPEKGLLTGFLVSEDNPGQSSYQQEGDADLSEGIVTLTDTGTYTYTAVQAANLGTNAGDPVAKA